MLSQMHQGLPEFTLLRRAQCMNGIGCIELAPLDDMWNGFGHHAMFGKELALIQMA